MSAKFAYARCTPESALDVCLSYQPDVLILDAEPLLIDWRAPDGNWALDPLALLARIREHQVGRLILLTNSARDFSGLPPELTAALIARARKPWTSRRRLNLSDGGAGVVCGDVSLTDGLLAARLGYTFVHLEVSQRPLYPRIQDRCGLWLTRRAYRHER